MGFGPEIEDYIHGAGFLSHPGKGQNIAALFGIQPAEGIGVGICGPKGFVVFVEMVEGSGESQEIPVAFKVQQHPVQFLLVIPFGELGEFVAHEA